MLKVTEQRMNCFMLIFRDLLTSIELTCWPWKNIVEREREGDVIMFGQLIIIQATDLTKRFRFAQRLGSLFSVVLAGQ